MVTFRSTLILGLLLIAALALSACTGSEQVSDSASATNPVERTGRDTPPEHCERSDEVEQMSELVAEEDMPEDNIPELVGGTASLYTNVSYPREARRDGAEGTVWLAFVVAEDGDLLDARVCQSAGHEALDREALQALEQSEWHPGTIDGEAVPVKMKYPVWFGVN